MTTVTAATRTDPLRIARRAPRLSLARQLLVFQLVLLAIVLAAVAVASLQQSRVAYVDEQRGRAVTVAEYVAAVPLVRQQLENGAAAQQFSVQSARLRTTTGVEHLVITDADGRVLASPDDPRRLRTTLVLSEAIGTGAWSGATELDGRSVVAASVPVLDDAGSVVGRVVVAQPTPSFRASVVAAAPEVAVFIGVAAVAGVLGSLWLTSRLKRQTLGLEPVEIGRLTEHREAMLHGIREGIVAVDAAGRVTLANDSARALLGLPDDLAGRRIDELGLDADAVTVLSAQATRQVDELLVNHGMLLAINQTVIHPSGGRSELITTLRDRTELVALQRELGSTRFAADTLRAQTHDFKNRLHTISVLIQLGDADAAVDYIDEVTRERGDLDRSVLQRIADPTVAAVLIAKDSTSREKNVQLELDPASACPRLDDALGADLVTVLANLVDNALDAASGSDAALVVVAISMHDDSVVARITDSGPGVDATLRDQLFEAGVTSKPSGDPAERHGFGLSVVALVANRRGGSVTHHLDDAGRTVFEALLPLKAPADA